MKIYENKATGIYIEIINKINKEIADLLWGVEWGTNGPIYQKVYNAEKDINIRKPHFLLLKNENELIGMCTVSERPMMFKGETVNSYYLQHFSVKKEYQGNKYSQLLIDVTKEYFELNSDKPAVGYAYIEGSNIRSQKAAKFIGYDKVRNFKTILFSRIFPKKASNFRRFKENEKSIILEKLTQFYKNHSFVHFTNTFHHDGYFVLEENGVIVAGVQAYPVEWKILRMPGISGVLIMNLVPKIPLINRLFTPKSHRFLVFDAFFYPKGKPELLNDLLESALVEYKRYSGLLWLEEKDEIFKDLEKVNQWGILDKVEGRFPVSTIAKFHGLSTEKVEEYKDLPMYIAGFDSL